MKSFTAGCSPTPPGQLDPELLKWLQESRPQVDELLAAMRAFHANRLTELSEAKSGARSAFWWPFTQHANMRDADVTIIDARHGDHLLTVTGASTPSSIFLQS